MLETDQNQFFESAIFQSTGKSVEIRFMYFITGGCINQSIQLITSDGTYFLKWNEEAMLDMFHKEAQGLALLRANTNMAIPQVLGYGKIGSKSYLLLEFIDSSYPKPNYWQSFGEQLAQMHKNSENSYFGLGHNNYIGKLAQSNEPTENWLEFFIEKRLRVQFGLAYYNGLIDAHYLKKIDVLHKKLEGFFPQESPSLLHGDLWAGNAIAGNHGEPCLFDPAVYYGHREMEMAFTKLFGGFEPAFYDAYQSVYPFQEGFEERKDIYNLYPLMVHANLFGTSYLSGVDKILKRMI